QTAISGINLNNARVSVVGTNRAVFTNASGEYRITDVPAGSVDLAVIYTGRERENSSVQVSAGQTTRQDFSLRTQSTAGEEDTVKMETFVVVSEREYNAQAIAINEQRFAPNPMNVVSTDAFGEINQGNIGEFLKHVPGVT